MRILFYGGCHAAAMRRISDRYAGPTVQAEHLTNFVLVAKKIPFPYEKLERFDAVVYTPILNRDGYTTDVLEDRCGSLGIPTVKVPWLEWHGYFPDTGKEDFGWFSGWQSRALVAEAQRHASFQEFFDAVVSGDALAEATQRTLAESTTRLKAAEQAGEVDVPVSDFVLERYQDQRLFLTPDHPATPVYHHVMADVEDRLGLRLDRSFYHSALEVQPGYRCAILPSVARALKLRFVGADFEHQELARDHEIGLRQQLEMVYAPQDFARVRATNATRLRTPGDAGEAGDAVSCRAGTRLVVRRLGNGPAGYNRVEVLAQPGAARIRRTLVGRELLLYRPHWAATPLVRGSDADGWSQSDAPSAPTVAVDPAGFVGAL